MRDIESVDFLKLSSLRIIDIDTRVGRIRSGPDATGSGRVRNDLELDDQLLAGPEILARIKWIRNALTYPVTVAGTGRSIVQGIIEPGNNNLFGLRIKRFFGGSKSNPGSPRSFRQGSLSINIHILIDPSLNLLIRHIRGIDRKGEAIGDIILDLRGSPNFFLGATGGTGDILENGSQVNISGCVLGIVNTVIVQSSPYV